MIKPTVLACALMSLVIMPTHGYAQADGICFNAAETRALALIAADQSTESAVKLCSKDYAHAAPFMAARGNNIVARFDNQRDQAVNVIVTKLIPTAKNLDTSKALMLITPFVDSLSLSAFDKQNPADSCSQFDMVIEAFSVLPDEDLLDVLSVLFRRTMALEANNIFRFCATP